MMFINDDEYVKIHVQIVIQVQGLEITGVRLTRKIQGTKINNEASSSYLNVYK